MIVSCRASAKYWKMRNSGSFRRALGCLAGATSVVAKRAGVPSEMGARPSAAIVAANGSCSSPPAAGDVMALWGDCRPVCWNRDGGRADMADMRRPAYVPNVDRRWWPGKCCDGSTPSCEREASRRAWGDSGDGSWLAPGPGESVECRAMRDVDGLGAAEGDADDKASSSEMASRSRTSASSSWSSSDSKTDSWS